MKQKGMGYKGYMTTRTYNNMRFPQHIQNRLIADYCKRQGLRFLFSSVENAMSNSYYVLNRLLKNAGDIEGIICCSLFVMPENKKNRHEVYNLLIQQNKSIHFIIENMIVSNVSDIEKCEEILLLSRHVKYMSLEV